MKKKPEDAEKIANETAGVGEEGSVPKKRSCVKCGIGLTSGNKLPFCPGCWEEIADYVKKAGIAMGALLVALMKKYGPKVGKVAFKTLKTILKR